VALPYEALASLTGCAAEAWWLVPTEWRSDRRLALEAVKHGGAVLRFLSEGLCGDRELALKAVTQNGLAVKLVSDELREDAEVVSEAVRQNGLAVRFARTWWWSVGPDMQL
jgi:hypothetical protein